MVGALESAFLLMLFLPALLGVAAGLSGRTGRAPGALCSVSCIAGVLCYPVWMQQGDFSYTLPVGSYLGSYSILFDQIGSLFITFSSAVFLMIVTHMSHSGHGYTSRYTALASALFLSVILCMCADTAILLLMAWECVSMVTFLLAYDPKDEGARWRFFAITHIGGLILMAAYAYMWILSGTDVLHEWVGMGASLDSLTCIVLGICLFMGFGTKLGTVPFHAWMPDVYAESPTHTSALLTTVCSNAAILMLFRAVFSYLGAEQMMAVGAFMCIMAAVSALWGAMESMVQTEPKRILSYSSQENMALVVMCFSLGILFSDENRSIMSLVIIAGLLHTLNHSVFKSLMMLAVDSVEDVTGERKIDRLGGLGRSLPGLSAVAFVGVASLAAIPPMNGFVSEWLMLQSLIGTDAVSSDLRVAMPLLIAMMGLCGMIVATSYARLYGFMFLGRPRSPGAENPRPLRKGSIGPLAVLALLCIAMGMLAFPLTDALFDGAASASAVTDPYRDGLSGSLEPLTLGLMIIGTLAVVYAILRVRRGSDSETDTWGCGGVLDERMQYSSEGFSQPLVRVFHPFYGDTSSVEGGRYRVRFQEPFVKFIYRPLGNLITFFSRQVTRIQTGNIQSYLFYILVTLVAGLMAVRLL